MQQRNFIWFMVLSFLILAGWAWLQNTIWKPKPPPEQKSVQKVDWGKLLAYYAPTARAANVIANRSLPVGGMLDEIRLVQDLLFTPPEPRRLVHWDDLTPAERQIAVYLPPPLPPNIGVLAFLIPGKTPEALFETIPFGGDKFHLQGLLATRGAGVQRLNLNKFEAANWLGEPVKGHLELIPDDPEVPSFLMYHYPAAKDKDVVENPVATLGRQIWKLEYNKLINEDNPQGPTQEVRFATDIPEEAFRHLRIFKTYRLGPRDYHLTLIVEVQDTRDAKASAKGAPFRYQLAGAHGLPIEGEWYTSTYRDSVIGMVDARGGLYRTKEEALRISVKKGGEPVPHPDSDRGASFLQYAGVMTQFFSSVIVVDNEQPPESEGGTDMKNILRWARPTVESVESKGILKDLDSRFVYVVDASGAERAYVLLPRVKKHIEDAKLQKETHVVISYYELDKNRRVATWIRPGSSPRANFDDLTVRVNSELLELKPGGKVAHQFMLYHGPVKTRLLGQFSGDKAVDPGLVERYTYKLHLNTLTDYPSAGPFGAFSQAIRFTDLLIFVTGVMHQLLYYLHFMVGSYGLTIILLTVLVRGLMFPISRKQAYFSVKMQEIAPEMKKLKEKYGADTKARTEATMELYRKHQVSPFGSCLPLLMQMPIFLGLYFALQESIHFRLAEFAWIKNLAAPDMFLWWSEKIPWVSAPDNLGGFFYLGPYLNLLPLFAVALMIVQQKMMTPPAMDEQQEMQQKMMKYMMVFFGIMFYKVASGLCIYFISSSLWGLAERQFLPKKKSAGSVTSQSSPPPRPGLPPPRGKGFRGKGPGPEKSKPDGPVQKVKDWWADVLKQAKKK